MSRAAVEVCDEAPRDRVGVHGAEGRAEVPQPDPARGPRGATTGVSFVSSTFEQVFAALCGIPDYFSQFPMYLVGGSRTNAGLRRDPWKLRER